MTRNQALDLCIAAVSPFLTVEHKWSQSPVAFGDREDGSPVYDSAEILPLSTGEADRLAALNEMAELGHGFPGLTTTQRTAGGL